MGRQGVRADWSAIPESVRAEIDHVAGSPVAGTTNLDGGFSPGPAARCDLADGRTVFVKAAGPELNPESPQIHRREVEVLAALPESVPAPRLVGFVDDGAWVALVIEWVDGRMPTAPLQSTEVEAMLDAAEVLADTPAPDGLVPRDERSSGNLHGHWAKLLADPPDGLDDWSRGWLRQLAELERPWDEAVRGDVLVHCDLRTDNVLLTAGGAVIVDWPWATRGAPWLDLVALLPALHLDGGPRPEDAFANHPVGRAAEADAVNVFLAGVAGLFTRLSLLPAPPGLPTLRAFQAAQGEIARAWLAARLGWD